MTEFKRLNIAIEADLHRKLKIRVAETDMTLAQFVRDAIAEKLEREENKKSER